MEKKIEVVNNNGQLVVSSRQVAETFGKRHDKLLHEIARMYDDYCVSEDTPKMVETPFFTKQLIFTNKMDKYTLSTL